MTTDRRFKTICPQQKELFPIFDIIINKFYIDNHLTQFPMAHIRHNQTTICLRRAIKK